jgi:hypothetical protein
MRSAFIAVALCSVIFLSTMVFVFALRSNRQWGQESDTPSVPPTPES